jgi:hypothetical protein
MSNLKSKQYRVYAVQHNGKFYVGIATTNDNEIHNDTILNIRLFNNEIIEDFAGNVKFG